MIVDSMQEGKERWVAYLDVLGFSEYVKDNSTPERWQSAIYALHEAFSETKEAFEALAADSFDWTRGLTCKMFSDSVSISMPHSERIGSCGILYFVSLAVSGFAERGLFVRGAVVQGHHYENDTTLFSPALVAAVDLERRTAVYPRVVTASEVIEDLAARAAMPEWGDYPRNILCEDFDGVQFINYLWRWYDDSNPYIIMGRPYELDCLERHRQKIIGNLQKISSNFQDRRDCVRIVAKYRWLATYHNRFCMQYVPEIARGDLLIPGSPLQVKDPRL